ncbi:MAG: ABC transporter substrate-binding protein [Defluviitaleaceae bacterium]|nr:ABC transporter substrate-binding protein [Defluviitaleaceae bacterium]
MLFKLFNLLVLLGALMLIWAGCGSQNGDLDEVTLVLDWTPNTNHTGFYVAMERGYFEDEGITLDIIQPPEDGAVLLVAAGHAQFGISFQEEVLLAANSPHAPLPIVAIAALVEHNTSGILSLAEHGITRFRDLEGRTFGSWMIPLYDEMVRESIRLDGGNPDLVEFVPHMALDNITGIQREFHATWVFEGWDRVMAEHMGLEVNYFALGDINPVFDYYTPVLITHERYVDDDLTARFMRASARGFTFARDNPKEAADILHSNAPEMSRDLLAASQEFLSGAYFSTNRWGYIDARRWNAFFYWMRDNEFIPADSSNAAFVNVGYSSFENDEE